MLSCSIKPEEHTISVELTNNVLSLNISDETANISVGLQGFYSDGNDYLANLNRMNNSLQLYDVDNEKLLKEIKFYQEGPQSVGGVLGFHIHSFDSIFLFSQSVNEVVLIDTTGQIRNRITYAPPTGLSNAFVHNSYFISQPILSDGHLIVKAHIEGNYREMTQQKLSKTPISYIIDLDGGTTMPLQSSYPEDYMPNGIKSFEYSMCSNGKNLVFSFFGDHRIFYINHRHESKLRTINAKSQFFKEELPIFPTYGGREDTHKYLFATERYESLLYDPFRDVYYRIAIPESSYQSESELKNLRVAPKTFSIIILNNQLKIINEILLEDNTYLPNNIFVGSKGLYISTGHPNNKNNQEDKMQFDCLKVKL